MIDASAVEDLKLIEDAEADVKAAQAALRTARDNYVEKHRRYTVGDELTVNGVVHEGKTMVVERCHLKTSTLVPPRIVYTGPIKKKNGKIGSQQGEHHDPIYATQEQSDEEEAFRAKYRL